MPKYSFSIILILMVLSTICFAQNSKISLGINSDFQLESPIHIYYGAQGHYQFNDKHAVQLNLGLISRTNAGYIGADYLYTLFQLKQVPSIFIGAGSAYEFATKGAGHEITFNGQVGAQFQIGRFVPFIGFKEKFYFEAESFDSGNLFLGVRFGI